jgi:hypothetical protein
MFRKGRGEHGEKQTEAVPSCAFCGKSQADVRKLIAGPTVMICDSCVAACVDIIVDDARTAESAVERGESQEMLARLHAHRLNAAEALAVPVPEAAIPLWHVRCALCRQIVPTETAFSIQGRGVLCQDCLAAAQTIQGHPTTKR